MTKYIFSFTTKQRFNNLFFFITIFTNKMKEIDDYYNSLVNDNNNRRKQVDVMTNKVPTIFKKN